MSRLEPEEFMLGALIAIIALAMVAGIGWLTWSSVLDRQDQHRCRDRGGNVEHVGDRSDWRCVGGTAERVP